MHDRNYFNAFVNIANALESKGYHEEEIELRKWVAGKENEVNQNNEN